MSPITIYLVLKDLVDISTSTPLIITNTSKKGRFVAGILGRFFGFRTITSGRMVGLTKLFFKNPSE